MLKAASNVIQLAEDSSKCLISASMISTQLLALCWLSEREIMAEGVCLQINMFGYVCLPTLLRKSKTSKYFDDVLQLPCMV